MRPKSLIALCITVFCAVCTAVSQNPRMLGDVNPNNTISLTSGGTCVIDRVSAALFGTPTQLYYNLDTTIRRFDATEVDELFIDPGPHGIAYSFYYLTPINTKLYFSGPGANSMYSEPWVTDGTISGTKLLYDAPDNGAVTAPKSFTRVGSGANVVFFGSNTNGYTTVFVTDGTPGGTKTIKRVGPTHGFGQYVMFPKNSLVYFFGTDGKKIGLWKTNGTSTGTTFVASTGPLYLGTYVLPVYAPPVAIDPYNGRAARYRDYTGPFMFNGMIYFCATTSSGGQELWESDGTANGTRQVADIYPGTTGSFPLSFAATANYLYFQADNGTSGRELYRMNLTTRAVTLVWDVVQGAGGSEPFDITAIGTKIYFNAYTTYPERHLFVFDEANSTGTQLVVNTLGSSFNDLNVTLESQSGKAFVELGGYVYFRAETEDEGWELWRTNGTQAGTHRVSDINPGSEWSFPTQLTVYNGKLYFRANDATHGREWWVLDPTQSFSKPSVASGETFDLALMNCDPNPFEGTTTITYSVPTSMSVRIDIIDMFGHVAATLTDAEQSAGVHSVAFDGRPFASGTFFCRLTAGSEQRTMKIVLMK